MSKCYLGPIPIGPPQPSARPQTHYVPSFLGWAPALTACGHVVDPNSHSTYPTCRECRAWLVAHAGEV